MNFLKKNDPKMKQELSQLSDLIIISILIFIMLDYVAIGKGVNGVEDISALHSVEASALDSHVHIDSSSSVNNVGHCCLRSY